eukprot:gene52509-11355_t
MNASFNEEERERDAARHPCARLLRRCRAARRRPVPKRALHRLGPIDMLRLHCRVPWTLLLHAALCALLFFDVLHLQRLRNEQQRDFVDALASAFAPATPPPREWGGAVRRAAGFGALL